MKHEIMHRNMRNRDLAFSDHDAVEAHAGTSSIWREREKISACFDLVSFSSSLGERFHC